MDGLDKLTKDDRFELLSAYVDNELSVSERRQVEAWLESDPEMEQQYRALSAISRSFQSIPAPPGMVSADDMLEAVFTKVDRKPRRWKIAGITTAIVAGIGALGAMLGGPLMSPQIAEKIPPENASPSSESSIKTILPIEVGGDLEDIDIESVDTDSLMLVLEAPPVEIPIVAETSFPNSSGQQ